MIRKNGRLAVTLVLLLTFSHPGKHFAQLTPPAGGGTGHYQLNSWPFTDTNWLSQAGFAPVGFTNLINLNGGGDGNALLLDTTNAIPAYLLYNLVETNGLTNLTTTNGTISLWFNPDWDSTDQGGTGPGDWANLINLGQVGTNGTSWWSWYLSPDGCTMYFSSQTNGTSSSSYPSAPVSFVGGNWYNLVLAYSLTNVAFYTNGVLVTNGAGISSWPGPDVTSFAIGSDTNGFYQAEGAFDDVATYNYPVSSAFVSGMFGIESLFYFGAAPFETLVVSAPSTNTVTPTFDAVTGAGFLTNIGTSATYSTSSNIWLTNYSATATSSNVLSIRFAVAGGSNGVPYDVFATTGIRSPITNATWYWMGQAYRGTNYAIPVTNVPPTGIFLVLAFTNDTDHDGLTDAYERLVSHTDPNNPDTDYDGRGDGWEFLDGTDPLSASSVSNLLLASWSFSDTNAWSGDQGQTPMTFTNLTGVGSWSGNAAQIGTNSILAYPESQLYGNANINCRNGTVSFWFKPLWNSGAGPGNTGRFLELGGEGSNGWWAIVVNTNGTSLSLITQTNSVKTTNATAPIDWIYTGWHQVVVTYSPSNSAIYLDGAGIVTNGSGVTSYPSESLRSLGLRIGSDINGSQQANGYFKKVATYTYPLASTVIASHYATDAALLPMDLDFDGLDAAAETAAGTSPTSPDTDGDGLSDWYEINVSHTSPTSAQPVPALSDRPINRCPSN
jgi:Concanavalin A-like lectin/glucanases superfamily/Bacterial TSP3 repeat